MLTHFFEELRRHGVPATPRELLDLLGALEKQLAFANMEEFYSLSRTCLVKDEKYYDRFDLAFDAYFKGLEVKDLALNLSIPAGWLQQELVRQLSDEDKARIERMGGLEKLMEELQKRLAKQREKHAGGDYWIGTGGTSPFGRGGYHPEGFRIGKDGSQSKAIKTWEQRNYQDLDHSLSVGTRNIQMALRRLRRFARTGATEELDMDGTIAGTARNAGMLDLQMRPERRNAVKVLLFLDVGGSMDSHVQVCEELFSAAASEFKHLEYFYFHNFIYEQVWKDNLRRHQESIPTLDVLHTYGQDYRVIFVGDAAMAPYEIIEPAGSVEHFNEEPGSAWMTRFTQAYAKVAWLNPLPQSHWDALPSVEMTRKLVDGHMYPLSIQGLEDGIAYLAR